MSYMHFCRDKVLPSHSIESSDVCVGVITSLAITLMSWRLVCIGSSIFPCVTSQQHKNKQSYDSSMELRWNKARKTLIQWSSKALKHRIMVEAAKAWYRSVGVMLIRSASSGNNDAKIQHVWKRPNCQNYHWCCGNNNLSASWDIIAQPSCCTRLENEQLSKQITSFWHPFAVQLNRNIHFAENLWNQRWRWLSWWLHSS